MAKATDLDDVMRDGILRGTMEPGSWLRMEELKARFAVGFSPIREALSRLVGEGLVEFEANRGFRVKGLSRADLLDIAVTRTAVEGAALRRSIALGDDRWEASVVGAMHRYRRTAAVAFDTDNGLSQWEAAHDELHAALIGACGSPRLMMLQHRLQEQHLRYRRLIVVPHVGAEAHIAEHEQLVEYALARDLDAAVAHIERHMMITVDALSNAEF
ncbi:GntR family transcriptional regulator [Novosphingobium taihuense]|uniref:DNA-binding GntR family transcriptional regulator n=1 Tax=Novosphingobium taihuense TaxID=260085 RepID=A0A7W7A8R6_9SPHN|nr:FCD domain-containing protein [Novosphingobium taihuense]MBB4612277.1 DNA-binding GntR family transcriptional regulator [Novosphingobium taihuense]TWH88369.1 GntR family transcriptional regulator [Novosphingobium taihuense]